MSAVAARSFRVNIAGYRVVCVSLGFVLLLAAAIKCDRLAYRSLAGSGLLHSRPFLIGVVELDRTFGLLLLAGVYPRPAPFAATAPFAAVSP
jgi:hypothetical protein